MGSKRVPPAPGYLTTCLFHSYNHLVCWFHILSAHKVHQTLKNKNLPLDVLSLPRKVLR